MSHYEIVKATAAHAEELACNMRAFDEREVLSLGMTPLEALTTGLRVSRDPVTGLVDGRVLGMFGVAQYTVMSREGSPWFLGSPEIPDHARAFLRFSRTGIGYVAEQYDILVNYVDARYLEAVRWIGWLGFTVEPAAPRGPDNVPFHLFWMKTK